LGPTDVFACSMALTIFEAENCTSSPFLLMIFTSNSSFLKIAELD